MRSAGDLRKEKHLAVWSDRLEEGILVDLTIDSHRHALIQMTPDRRIHFDELLEELLHGRRRELELGDAPRELREVADQHHARHVISVGAGTRPPRARRSARPGFRGTRRDRATSVRPC